ncbi:hypothetical protein VTJ49DRAFT_2188 [Mycothermus thermophilus]|uniref:Zn(2)-C6 fungal-type domain-containing protein n=1 Tax=Humicola insolens TaxID=85995 RepID=A0ABR3VBT7_HUMIN
MARLRLGYTKSRTGCLRCKQRRVKCDEARPACGACVRHGIECSLSTAPPPSANKPPPPAPARRSRPIKAPTDASNASTTAANTQPPTPAPSGDHAGSARSESGPSPDASTLTPAHTPSATSPDPFPYLTRFVTGPCEEDTANWVVDLELLHHFTLFTYNTFVKDPESAAIAHLWRVEVPKLAFAHVFLLHQILAIAAYHLAYLKPESRATYSLRASHHQNAGIRQMRHALSDITPSNCHALFASSSLLWIGSLAASSVNRPAGGPVVDDLVDVMILVKGIGSVLYSSHDVLQSGPLSEMFALHQGPEHPNPALDRVVLAVADFLVEIAETEPDGRVRAIVHADAYRLVTAIRDALVKTPAPEYRVVASWPIQMSDDLIPLLRQRNQAALALLSYYCVVFHAAEMQGYWFMQGWSEGVIQDITKTVTGPWKRHSAWAQGWITGHSVMG